VMEDTCQHCKSTVPPPKKGRRVKGKNVVRKFHGLNVKVVNDGITASVWALRGVSLCANYANVHCVPGRN